jgi:hypothetical protein
LQFVLLMDLLALCSDSISEEDVHAL